MNSPQRSKISTGKLSNKYPGIYALVVDDDPNARVLMTVLIESLGVAVRTAKDGAEALEAVKQEKPAIMLLDLMMPNVDGLAVLRALQANPDVRDIPVLVMTATRFEKTELSEVYARVLDVVRKGDLPMGEISRVIEKTVSDRQTDHFAHEEARDNDQRT